MSSPVPRRESPWGMPEGDNRQPKPHRCNDRVEDVVQEREMFASRSTKAIVPCFQNQILNPYERLPELPIVLCRHVLKVIHLKQYQDLSSYSISACVLSLGKSLPSHSTTYSWNLPREKRSLSRALVSLISKPVVRLFTNPVSLGCVTWGQQSVLWKVVHGEYFL